MGAGLEVMERDARAMRGDRSFVFTSPRAGNGSGLVVDVFVTVGSLALSV